MILRAQERPAFQPYMPAYAHTAESATMYMRFKIALSKTLNMSDIISVSGSSFLALF